MYKKFKNFLDIFICANKKIFFSEWIYFFEFQWFFFMTNVINFKIFFKNFLSVPFDCIFWVAPFSTCYSTHSQCYQKIYRHNAYQCQIISFQDTNMLSEKHRTQSLKLSIPSDTTFKTIYNIIRESTLVSSLC